MLPISRAQLQTKLQQDDSIPLVEVLSPDSYNEFHLPGAVNVPLNGDFDDRIRQVVPDKNQEVVVYCKDTECTASPTAAQKMDQLGYQYVFDYEAGKDDWKGAGLPIETGN